MRLLHGNSMVKTKRCRDGVTCVVFACPGCTCLACTLSSLYIASEVFGTAIMGPTSLYIFGKYFLYSLK